MIVDGNFTKRLKQLCTLYTHRPYLLGSLGALQAALRALAHRFLAGLLGLSRGSGGAAGRLEKVPVWDNWGGNMRQQCGDW